MARHRTPEEKRALGEQARAMRAAGKSRREILRELHIGEDLLAEFLDATAVPSSLRRPNAKDDVRAKAVELRLAGKTYDEIARELGVSKSSCSLWLRDLPRPERDPVRRERGEQQRLESLRATIARKAQERDAEGDAVAAAAASRLFEISPRDLVIAFVVSYWCEGAKRKPWSRQEQVTWMNSDPVLVRLYLEGLRLFGVDTSRIVCQLHIHETADDAAARAWWQQHTGLPEECFAPTVYKRHKPRTRRKNVDAGYRGCLSIRVRQSRELYLVIRGLVEGLAALPRVAQVAR